MTGRFRWWLAVQLNRLDRMCWADLVSWALRSPFYRWPWQAARSPMCTRDAAECGLCYCGKLRGDGQIMRGGGR